MAKPMGGKKASGKKIPGFGAKLKGSMGKATKMEGPCK